MVGLENMRRLFLTLVASIILAGCGQPAPAPPTVAPAYGAARAAAVNAVPPTAIPATSVPGATTAAATLAATNIPPTRAPGGAADHVLGVDSAFLTIILYGDFQCAACMDVAGTLAILHD